MKDFLIWSYINQKLLYVLMGSVILFNLMFIWSIAYIELFVT